MKKVMKYIFIIVSVFLINSKVLALTEKYEVIDSEGWGTTTEVNIKNTLNDKKATEYVVYFPYGSSYNMESNSNPLCVYPIKYLDGYKYFPLSNSCKTTINYTGLTKGATSSNFSFNVSVNSKLPTLKTCTDTQFKSLNFSDPSNSLCYYCESHQCLGDINAKETTKEVGIIYKEANKHLKIQFESSFGNLIYQSKDKYQDVSKGSVDSVKSIKDDDKRAIMIKLNGQTGKLPYLTYYNQDTIAGAGVINVEGSEGSTDNTVTNLSKSCPSDTLSDIKKISGVGSKIECYYCDQKTCQGNITVGTDVNTVALVYKQAVFTLKIAFKNFESDSFYQSKNEWEEIGYYSINSIYGAKSEHAILLNLTGKDGTLNYKVKYNDNSEAGSGNIIIGTGINPENGQDGSNYNGGTEVNGCEVVPPVVKKWIKVALNFVKYVALVLVIILGTLDFIKAAGSGEPDAMKKAGQSFIKRVVAVIILFLLPMIVDLLLNLIELYGANTDCFGVLE